MGGGIAAASNVITLQSTDKAVFGAVEMHGTG
jgi:hypothetical protein